jgi:hypothetical protein
MLSLDNRLALQNLINQNGIKSIEIGDHRSPYVGCLYSKVVVHASSDFDIDALKEICKLNSAEIQECYSEVTSKLLKSRVYHGCIEESQIVVFVSLDEKEKDSAQDGATDEKLQSQFTINDLPVEEYLKREA